MVLRFCSINDCRHPAERSIGSCSLCSRHLCAEHVRSSLHTCPSVDIDPDKYFARYDAAKTVHLGALLRKVDANALASAASRARDGIPCHIPALAADLDPADRVAMAARQCGGQNCHIDIVFADGVTWLARLRLEDPLLPPAAVQARIFLSEIATLAFLEKTRVPAPRVYAYALESGDNAVGTSYVLMEKLPGQTLDWGNATDEQRAKVMEQLVSIYVELEQHPLPLTGSLEVGGEAVVGPFAQLPCFDTPDKALGPFSSLAASYTAILQQQLRMLASHEISSLPVDNYLTLSWRLHVLSDLLAGSVSRSGPFYLKHYDDKGDHILVDDEFRITGIIDWEFASAEAKELAFSAPCMMWPVGDFYAGSNNLSVDELHFAALFARRGRRDMADIVRQGRRWQRYLFFLGGGIPRDTEELQDLFRGLLACFADEQCETQAYEDWKQAELVRRANDAQLRSLLAEQPAVK